MKFRTHSYPGAIPPTRMWVLLLVVFLAMAAPALAEMGPPWVRVTPQGEKIIRLHFFWSKLCPHCQKAKPFVKALAETHDWLELESYEISENAENAQLFEQLSTKSGAENLGVPAFLFCGGLLVGYADEDTTGALLRDKLLECRNQVLGKEPTPAPAVRQTQEPPITLPLFGELDPARLSLPVFTILIAAVDAFNPCAFFVLILLLSLLTTAKSRKRMLAIGGIFVFFSGFIYFIFMAAWLNFFLYLGELQVITTLAAVLALAVALVNIKDYFFFKKGVSLSIPEKAKPVLYQKIRTLVNAASWPTMIVGVASLAIVANSYELLCTSGFPMVFTRVLTLNDLPPAGYYLYLALYNLIYVVPLMIIVLIFVKTLGSRKLTEREGRILKLTSGLMMFGLGLLLLVAPELLSSLVTAFGLVAGAVLLTFLIVYSDKKFHLSRNY